MRTARLDMDVRKAPDIPETQITSLFPPEPDRHRHPAAQAGGWYRRIDRKYRVDDFDLFVQIQKYFSENGFKRRISDFVVLYLFFNLTKSWFCSILLRFLFFIAFVPAVAKIRTDVFPAITHRSPDWWVEKIYGGVVIMDLVVRIILCFIFPPLAVFDKGCGAILLVLFLIYIF